MDMELTKLNFDDFYKFCMSAGIILFLFSLVGINFVILFVPNWKILNYFAVGGYFITGVTGIWLIQWSGRKWYDNQKLHDIILKNNSKLTNNYKVERVENKLSKKVNEFENRAPSKTRIVTRNKSPRIEYALGNSFPGTVRFNFIKDKKVWFMVRNDDSEKYLTYFTMSLYFDEEKIETIKEGYYGGKKAWNLNSNIRIVAPGMQIPDKIFVDLKNKKNFRIKIDCEIKNEKDKMIEKRLPVSYVYNVDGDEWYF